jgi:hypothetical protein
MQAGADVEGLRIPANQPEPKTKSLARIQTALVAWANLGT